MDETLQVYINRVARMTLPEARKSQVQHIQPSPKFQLQTDGQIDPTPFPGYTVITPPWVSDAENEVFYEQLQQLQQQIGEQLPTGLLVPLPPESFHLTLADLIWDSAFQHAVDENSRFEPGLRDRITQIFQEYQPLLKTIKPIYWQALGLTVMTRSLGVCLAPKDESAYEQILLLRRAIYQDLGLIALGIEQQYYLTAHVTLGYFGFLPDELDRDQISDTLSQLNDHWLDHTPLQPLWIQRAELRKFDDMTQYYRKDDWPAVQF